MKSCSLLCVVAVSGIAVKVVVRGVILLVLLMVRFLRSVVEEGPGRHFERPVDYHRL